MLRKRGSEEGKMRRKREREDIMCRKKRGCGEGRTCRKKEHVKILVCTCKGNWNWQVKRVSGNPDGRVHVLAKVVRVHVLV